MLAGRPEERLADSRGRLVGREEKKRGRRNRRKPQKGGKEGKTTTYRGKCTRRRARLHRRERPDGGRRTEKRKKKKGASCFAKKRGKGEEERAKPFAGQRTIPSTNEEKERKMPSEKAKRKPLAKSINMRSFLDEGGKKKNVSAACTAKNGQASLF